MMIIISMMIMMIMFYLFLEPEDGVFYLGAQVGHHVLARLRSQTIPPRRVYKAYQMSGGSN
jgi:hypothetical protein